MPDRASAALSWLYLFYALPMILFLVVTMPPFQVTDEYHHALRADQVSRGTWFSPRLGGHIDGALRTFGRPYEELQFRYERKQTVAMARAAAALTWDMSDQNENFQNTAQYGPLLYLPQAAGIWIGKLAGLNPVWTLLFARLVNAMSAALIGFFTIRLCRRSRALLFTTLLLPMTISGFASVSQDALIISLSLLAIALVSRVVAQARPAKTWEFALFVAVVVVTTLARPSQFALAPLGALLLKGSDQTWQPKAVLAALGSILIILWLVFLPGLMPAEPPGASVPGQLNAIIRQPLLLPYVLYNTFRESAFWLLETLVGRLGWLDTPMPHWYTWTAAIALACAWLAPGNRLPWTAPASVGLLTFLAVLFTSAAALYASWTAVGRMTIEGVQGRYILPVLPLLGFLAPAYGPRTASLMTPNWVLVLAFPLASMTVLPGTIMARYYGSWSDMSTVLGILYY